MMGQILDRIKSLASKKVTDSGMPDVVLFARIVFAAILTAVALIIKMPAAVRVALLILATIIAGIDIGWEAVDAVLNKDFFAAPVVLLVVVFLCVGHGFISKN